MLTLIKNISLVLRLQSLQLQGSYICSACMTVRLYCCLKRIKHRYAVLKGRRERDIVRLPAPVQIAAELPTATVFYSGIESRGARNLVGSAMGMQTSSL